MSVPDAATMAALYEESATLRVPTGEELEALNEVLLAGEPTQELTHRIERACEGLRKHERQFDAFTLSLANRLATTREAQVEILKEANQLLLLEQSKSK